jgi:hypothetical protein
MRLSITRWFAAVGSGLLFFSCLVPSGALARDKAMEIALGMFFQSIAAQGTARLCVRGIPGYRRQFDDVFGRWTQTHRDRLVKGEAAFQAEKARGDLEPSYRAKLEQVDKVVAELAKPATSADPISLDAAWREECDRVLNDLKRGL